MYIHIRNIHVYECTYMYMYRCMCPVYVCAILKKYILNKMGHVMC